MHKRVVSLGVVLMAFLFGVAGGLVGVLLLSSGQQGENAVDLPMEVVESKLYLEESQLIDSIQEALPSVVSILLVEDDSTVGTGTGFIISESGLVLTNRHVVANDDVEYRVVLGDGVEYQAELVDRDPFNDIAFVQINVEDAVVFDPLELGDSDNLQLGQRVFAVGNALGLYGNSVTSGIISAVGRNISAYNDFTATLDNLSGLIQTDAAINLGNSGGPLVNLQGQVIGMNVAVAEAANNIGFSIPINDVKPVITSVEKYGEIIRPVLGVRFLMLTPREAEELGIGVEQGALIIADGFLSQSAVIPGGAGDLAGLQEKDVILSVNGLVLDLENPLHEVIRRYEPGDKVELVVNRLGEELVLEVELQSSKDISL